MSHFYDSLLSVGHKFDVNDFSSDPFVIFCLAVDEVSFVKFFSRDVLYWRVMISDKVFQIGTQLINNDVIGFFEIQLFQCGLILDQRKVPDDIVAVDFTNRK